MRLAIVLAIVPVLAIDIIGYRNTGCSGEISHTCHNIPMSQCCSFQGYLVRSVRAELNSPVRWLSVFRPLGMQMCGRECGSGHPPPGVVCVECRDEGTITGAMWTEPSNNLTEVPDPNIELGFVDISCSS